MAFIMHGRSSAEQEWIRIAGVVIGFQTDRLILGV
jgi:hypothetical protein